MTTTHMLPGGQGGHSALRHTPQGGGAPARPGLNQAQREAARHASRLDKWKGRRDWEAAKTEAIWLLARGHKHGALEAVMRGHRAEVFHTLGIGELRTRSAS